MSVKDIKLGVSLYSYQEAIWRGDLDLEGALTAVKGCGADGVELFGESIIRTFPYITDEFLYKWFSILDKLQLEPVCYEHFADRRFSVDLDSYLDDNAIFETTMTYLRSAKKLGCKLIRLSHTGHNGKMRHPDDPARNTVDEKLFERLLPRAEELGVKMALEVHASGTLQDGGNDGFLEAIERTGCYGGGGLMLDLSSCFRDISPMQEKQLLRRGVNPDILAYMREMDRKAYTYDGNNDVDWDEVEARIKEMGGTQLELDLLNVRYMHGPLRNRSITPPEIVKEWASRLCYVHGKMYWVNEDYTSDELDYARVIKALVDGGYKGYISTEFEGQRLVPHTINEVELVRRQHVLMRRCLAELEK